MDKGLLTDNSQLLCKKKYHCTADALLDRIGFNKASQSVANV